MTSRDDFTRAAVAPMLAELRGDLLQLPDEAVVEQHLGMMAFEAQVLATPKFVEQRTHRPLPHSKRAVVAFVAALSTLVSCGLSAAGALPAPLQHITESIAHTFGVPNSEPTSPADLPGRALPPANEAPANVDTPPETPPPTATPKPAAKPRTSTPPKAETPPTSTPPALPSAETPIAPTRPHNPPERIKPSDPGTRPSENSSNTPPGFPTDWHVQATTQAAVHLAWTCSQETTLTPTACPQQATTHTGGTRAQAVEWTLVNDPFGGAAVVAKTRPGDPAHGVHPTTNITVYLAFQMIATYKDADGSGPYRAYSAGIAAATMRWDGSSFVDVSFTPGSVAGQLLPGVKPPSLQRPAGIDDGRVLAAVQSGFIGCTVTPPADSVIPACPQTTVAGEQWTVTGDPTQGAAITYDSTDGLFTVTGTYAMTSNLGNTAGGNYTALLYLDGSDLQVLSISSS